MTRLPENLRKLFLKIIEARIARYAENFDLSECARLEKLEAEVKHEQGAAS